MSSINTNVAAMTALQTLQATNSAMEDTQSRISTGYRVNSASDNAAYWSIATTMRSDKSALSSVVDALGIGEATVDTAYTAMESTKDLLNDIKAKLTTATGENVSKDKVQKEISALQETIKSIAGSASFSGSNFLSVNGTSTNSLIGSFSRDAAGTVTLGSIKIDTKDTALFNSKSDQYGLLEKGGKTAVTDTGGQMAGVSAAVAGTTTAKASQDFSGIFVANTVFKEDDVVRFDVTRDGGKAVTVTIDRATVNSALTVTNGTIATAANMATVLNKALDNAGITDYRAKTTGAGIESTAAAGAATDGKTVSITNVESTNNGNFIDAASFDITGADRTKIDKYLKDLDKVISSVVDAAATLGASKNQIDMQSDFTKKLMNTIDKGIGTLVDADMTEESTKLKALQTQQQLGVQALSMANSSSQSLLSLFR